MKNDCGGIHCQKGVTDMETRLYELLDLLVKYNTESPPGRNTDPLQDEIQHLLKGFGFSIQREQLYKNDSVIVATLKGATRPHQNSY